MTDGIYSNHALFKHSLIKACVRDYTIVRNGMVIHIDNCIVTEIRVVYCIVKICMSISHLDEYSFA